MIRNGNSVPLNANPGTLPNPTAAMLSWFQPMTFQKLTKTVVGFVVNEAATTVTTQGVRQPFSPRKLAMKPEGQRDWAWQTMHVLPGVPLEVDDIIVFAGVNYRVEEKLDWSEYGFIEFHIVEDYT